MLQLSDQVIRFDPTSRLCETFYDEVNQKVFTVRSGGPQVNVTVRGPTEEDAVLSFRYSFFVKSFSKIVFSIADKGDITSIKLAPNGRCIAVQRTATTVVGCFSSQFAFISRRICRVSSLRRNGNALCLLYKQNQNSFL